MADISKLDPNIKIFLDKLNGGAATHPHPHSPQATVAEGRKAYLFFSLNNAGWPLAMARVEDHWIPSSDPSHNIPIRIYTPTIGKTLPALIYFHGGGWQRGDIATHDSICRHFAHYAGCIVISVQWRLAPENKFPIGPNDCLAAYEWIVQNGKEYNIDTKRLGISGDSAGGNMTAILAQRLRSMDIQKPIFQLLCYAALDLSCSTHSYIDFAEGFFLSTERVKYYVAGYVNSPSDIDNPLCSPLKNPDLKGLPPTHIVTAGFDPLHDEGKLYAERLKEAGIPVTYKCYEGFIHAFLHMNDSVPAVETALQEISEIVKKALFA